RARRRFHALASFEPARPRGIHDRPAVRRGRAAGAPDAERTVCRGGHTRRTLSVRNPLRWRAAAGAEDGAVSWPGAARPIARRAANPAPGCALAGRLHAEWRASSTCLGVRRCVRAAVGHGLLGLLLLL